MSCYVISAPIVLTSPMHVSSGITWHFRNGRYWRGEFGPEKIAGTMTQTLHLPRSGETVEVPYLPANGLRGRLRRHAAGLLIERLVETIGPNCIDLTTYAGLMMGNASGRIEDADSVEEILRARQHVFMGLFGGGIRMLRSHYRVSDLLPVHPRFVDEGLMPPGILEAVSDVAESRAPAALETWCGHRHFLHRDDVGKIARPQEMTRAVKDWEQALAAWIASTAETHEAVREQRKARSGKGRRKAAAEASAPAEPVKNYTVENFQQLMTVRVGTIMHLHLEWFAEATPEQTGLMLLALRELVNAQALGGWIRAGFGRFHFAADAKLETPDGETVPVFEVESETPYRVRLTENAHAAYGERALAALEGADPEELRSYFVALDEAQAGAAA